MVIHQFLDVMGIVLHVRIWSHLKMKDSYQNKSMPSNAEAPSLPFVQRLLDDLLQHINAAQSRVQQRSAHNREQQSLMQIHSRTTILKI